MSATKIWGEKELADRQAFFTERVAKADIDHPGYAARWTGLTALILANGGVTVVPPLQEDRELDALLGRGGIVAAEKVQLLPMETGACHDNAAGGWMAARTRPDIGITGIGTGCALSTDQLWRKHSWLMHETGLIETTEGCEARSCRRWRRCDG